MSALAGFRSGWLMVFGKPDGWYWHLHCWVRGGHKFETCVDECCEGDIAWCVWCLAPHKQPHWEAS